MTSAKLNTKIEPVVETSFTPGIPPPAGVIFQARPTRGCNGADSPLPLPLTERVKPVTSSTVIFLNPLRTEFV